MAERRRAASHAGVRSAPRRSSVSNSARYRSVPVTTELVALLLAARETLVDGPVEEAAIHLDQLELLVQQLEYVHGVELVEPARGPQLVDRRLEESGVAHAGDLDGVLKRQEQAGPGPILGRHGQEILAEIRHLAAGDGVGRMPGERLGQRALARAVRSHDGLGLAGAHLKIQMSKDGLALDTDGQVADAQHQPMLPSRLTPSSLVASTANSIGSFLKTSLQNPLMIIDTALSPDRPRCLQ